MTILAELAGTMTVTDDGTPSLDIGIEITDALPETFVLYVDARASVAFAQRFQQLGVGIKINSTWIPDREIGKVLTIVESRDSYGDRLVFELIGERWSPFARAILLSKAHVEVFFVIGNTKSEFRKKVFDGYVVSHTYDGHPPAATVTCLDAAALYAQKRQKTWTLAANSGRSRLSIGSELLSACGIPQGTLDLGPSGTVRKALAPGNQPILDYARDMWAILGAEIGFEDGLLCARRYDPTAPPVLEIHAGVIIVPFNLASPDTLSPNVTGVISTSFTVEEMDGQKTTETSSITVGPYAPLAAVGYVQEGVSVRPISEVTTRTTSLGSVDTRVEQEEKSWYAERDGISRISESEDPPGYTLTPELTSYAYPDGSTRHRSREVFQTTRRTIRTKDLDANNNVVREREDRYFFRFFRRALWQIIADPPSGIAEVLIADGSLINDDGDGVVAEEQLGSYGPDEWTETVFTLNDDGTIHKETTTEAAYDIGQKRPRVQDSYGYGIDPRTYTNRSAEAIGPAFAQSSVRVTTKTYRVISEDRYEVTQTVRTGSGPPTTTTTSVIGSLPRPEHAEPRQTTQEISATVNDLTRIALAGEEIEQTEHNEFVETSAEAAFYARMLARRAAAKKLKCSIPIESLVHKFRNAHVNLPGTSIHDLTFYIVEVERNAASFEEGITAEYYPPEFS